MSPSVSARVLHPPVDPAPHRIAVPWRRSPDEAGPAESPDPVANVATDPHWSADEVFERALHSGNPLHLVHWDGPRVELDVNRWLAPPDTVDHSVLDRCEGPVLDVGCGPGRMLLALQHRRVEAAGVDVTPGAVRLATTNGATVWCQSVYESLPVKRRWRTILLLDGNIGISGHPSRLLSRLWDLLGPGGQAIVEIATEDIDAMVPVSLSHEGRSSRPFIWAYQGLSAVERRAAAIGYQLHEHWALGGRQFVSLSRN